MVLFCLKSQRAYILFGVTFGYSEFEWTTINTVATTCLPVSTAVSTHGKNAHEGSWRTSVTLKVQKKKKWIKNVLKKISSLLLLAKLDVDPQLTTRGQCCYKAYLKFDAHRKRCLQVNRIVERILIKANMPDKSSIWLPS